MRTLGSNLGAQYKYPTVFENAGNIDILFFEYEQTSKILNIFTSNSERSFLYTM